MSVLTVTSSAVPFASRAAFRRSLLRLLHGDSLKVTTVFLRPRRAVCLKVWPVDLSRSHLQFRNILKVRQVERYTTKARFSNDNG